MKTGQEKSKTVWIIIGLLGISAICLFVIALFTLPGTPASEPTATVVSKLQETKNEVAFQDVLNKTYAADAYQMFQDCSVALDIADARVTDFDNDNTIALNDVWFDSMNTALTGLETYCIPIKSIGLIVPEDYKILDEKFKLASSELESFINNYRPAIEAYRKGDYTAADSLLDAAKTNQQNFSIYITDAAALFPK